jgi:hypothetical protein
MGAMKRAAAALRCPRSSSPRAVTDRAGSRPASPGIDTAAWICRSAAGRFLSLRERQWVGQHADSRRPVRLRHLRDGCAIAPRNVRGDHSKSKDARKAAAGSLGQKVGVFYKSFMDESD